MGKLLRLLAVSCAAGAVVLAWGAATAREVPRYTVVEIDLRTERLEVFLRDDTGAEFKRLDRLEAWLAARGRQLVFAMNAGMYHADFSPVGLLVQEGREVAPLNMASDAGNFFLKPNGVFAVTEAGPRVVASAEYPGLAQKARVQLATQSGPLLLRRGVVHPAFLPHSDSRKIRNGVGVSGRRAIFVISEDPVNFHEFALYFRDVLGCRDALYLDGTVSSLFARVLGRSDFRRELGPILGVAVPLKKEK